jgi:hypothetical protein
VEVVGCVEDLETDDLAVFPVRNDEGSLAFGWIEREDVSPSNGQVHVIFGPFRPCLRRDLARCSAKVRPSSHTSRVEAAFMGKSGN